jgi:hypothetical protein
MCSEANCQHTRFDPNANKTLSTEDQAALWSRIKATRKAMAEHTAFLKDIGGDAAGDPQMIKLEATTRDLWSRFRKL